MTNFLPDFKLSLRVNNQITVTRQRLIRKSEPFFLPSDNENHSHIPVEALLSRYADRNGIDSYYDSTSRKTVLLSNSNSPKRFPCGIPPHLLLDLTHKFQEKKSSDRPNENKTKKGYGAKPSLKNFSAKSGQKLRECGAAIDILCNGAPNLCRVITLTLPASGSKAYTALSDWSGYATNRLLQVVRDTKDDRFHWFYCIEHQKRGAIHYHICLYHEYSERSREIGASIVSKWKDILRDIGERSGVDLLFSKGFNRRVESHEMQSINQEMLKGCGAYFSKYAGKTSHARDKRQGESLDTVNARLFPPSSFWGRSQNLARLCRQNAFLYRFDGIEDYETESLRADMLDIMEGMNIVMCNSFSFKKEIECYGGSLTVCEGHSEVFYLSPSDYLKVLSICRERFGKSPSSRIPERAKRGGYLSEYEMEVGYF